MPRPSMESNYEQGILSTANAADLCNVSPITVRKWLDANKIPTAFRMPDSKEWKIPAPGLERFMYASKIPVPHKLTAASSRYLKRYTENGELK